MPTHALLRLIAVATIVVLPITLSACDNCPTPVIGGLQGAPVTVAPEETVSIYIDEVNTTVPVTYVWSVQQGKIVSGQGTSIIQYQAPITPGTYIVTVNVSACKDFRREMSAPVTVSTPVPTPTATETLVPTPSPFPTVTETPMAPFPPSLPCSTTLTAALSPYEDCPVAGASGNVQYCQTAPGKFVASVELHGLLPNRNYVFSLQAAEGMMQTDDLLWQSCEERTHKGDAYCDVTLRPTDEQGEVQHTFSVSLEPGHYDLKFLLKDAETLDYCVTMVNDFPPSIDVTRPVSFQQGLCYASWQQGQYSTPEADQSLAELAATGAEWIALVVTGYQETYTSTVIQRDTFSTPTDDDLIHVINEARELGLNVMLKPHIDLLNDPDHWRGQIGAGFPSESEWQTWFAAYGEFINHYVTLAAQNQDVVKLFSVGTELVSTSARDVEWRAIIQEVRRRFSGELVYASNWDEPARDWWADLDYIGVDAYFPLPTGSDVPTVEELRTAWQPHVATLENLYQRYRRPLILTELGYRSVHGAHNAPAQFQTDAPVDLTEQANLYRAALETFWGRDWLAGIYWWNWLADPDQGGPEDADYTPHNKPAEEVLREYYLGGEHIAPPLPTSLPQALVPFYGPNSCPIDGSSGEVLYGPASSGYFRATVRLRGLEPYHAYVFTINCREGSSSCTLLQACRVWNGQGYCDIRLAQTDATGALETNIEQPLPLGEYEVKFFIKDQAVADWCILLYNDFPEPFTVE